MSDDELREGRIEIVRAKASSVDDVIAAVDFLDEQIAKSVLGRTFTSERGSPIARSLLASGDRARSQPPCPGSSTGNHT